MKFSYRICCLSLVFLLSMIYFPAMVHAESNGNTLTITYAVGDGGEEQTAELTKIGDITTYNDWVAQSCTGEVFVTYLPANSVIKNASTNSTEPTIRTWWYQKPIEGAAGFQNINNVPIDPASFLNEDDFNTIKTQKSITNSTFNYVDENEPGIKTENVTGTVIRFYPTAKGLRSGVCQDDLIIVQISTEGAAPVNKDALLELINSVPTSGYHTENDTWNGKDESTNGFWADMQAIKAEMQNAYEDDSLTQAQVDTKVASFAESLAIAKSKLIKEENVNASALYKTTKGIESTTWNQDNYSEGSWQRFTEAREVATNLIADLYNAEDGKPTEANGTSIKQSDVDAANDLLVAAKNDLLEKDVKKILPRWLNVAGWVLEQDPKEAKYTSDSFASWSSAKEAVSTYVQQGEEEILRSKTNYRNFMNSVVDAVTKFYALEESAESITVHVRVVDNYGMKYPQYAIEDKRTSAFDGDIILSQNKTLQGLFGEEGKLDTAPKELTDYEENQLPEGDGENVKISSEKFKRPRNIMHSHTYAYINGTLAVSRAANEEVEMATLTHFDLYDGEFATVENDERCVADHFKLLNTKLSDGDDIVIVRAEAPMARYWAQSNGLLCHGAYYRYHYHNFTELTIDGDKVIEAKPDEKLSITVHEQEKTADTNDPEKSYAKDVNLFLSDPQVSKEDAKAEPALTIVKAMDGDDEETVATDEDGTAEFSVAKEGWYKLQVAKTATQFEVYFDQDKTVDGTYPNLAAGEYIFVHVTMDKEFEDLAEAKPVLDGVLKEAADAKSAYESSKEAAETAAATPGEEAVAAANKALADAKTAQEKAAEAKEAVDQYQEAVQALAAKKEQMSDAHKADITSLIENAEEMASDAAAAKDAADAEVKKAEEAQDKAVTKAALKECQDEIAKLKQDVADKQSEIDALKSQNTTNQNKINELNSQIEAAQAEISALQESGEADEEMINKLNEQIETAQGKIDTLTQQITDNQTEINTLKDQVAAAQSTIEDLTNLTAAKKDAIDKLNKYLDDNAKEILPEDSDSAELAVLKAIMSIKDAASEEDIKKAYDAAIKKLDEKISVKRAVDTAKAQKVKGLKVKVKKNKATVTWKKNAKVTGYEVFRSMKKKGGYKKVATLKKNTKVKLVNKNLKKGKKYFYKVRTFTKVNGKTYYGKYTAVKATKKIK